MGRYLEDFELGQTFVTHGRTITETDIINYASVTGDWNPVHMDETVAAPLFGGRIAHGPFFVGLAWGMLRQHDLIEGTVVALRSIEWKFSAPVRIGDTVRLTAEVTEVRAHPKKLDRGRVSCAVTFTNQRGEAVNRGTATLIMQSRGGQNGENC